MPASFDAAARELTLAAATQAGLRNVTLLEEPQAALYAWIEALGEGFRKLVRDRRHPAGRGCGRRHHRFLPYRRHRASRRGAAYPSGGRGPHPAGRRQHGPDARAPSQSGARRGRQEARFLAVRVPHLRLPPGERTPVQRPQAQEGPDLDSQPRLRPDRRHRRKPNSRADALERILTDGFIPRTTVTRTAADGARGPGWRRWPCPTPRMPASPATSPRSSAVRPAPWKGPRRCPPGARTRPSSIPPPSSSTAGSSKPPRSRSVWSRC